MFRTLVDFGFEMVISMINPTKFWFQNHSALRAVKLQPHCSGLAASEACYAGTAVMLVPYQCLPYTLGTKMFRTPVDFSFEMVISMIV